MFNINDMVICTGSGVCNVEDIKRLDLGMGEREYYVLKPVCESSGTVYVPVSGCKNKLKKLLGRQEIYDVIASAGDECWEWQEDNKQRRERAEQTLRRGNHKEIIRFIKTYSVKKSEFEALHKKFFVADEKALQQATDMLFQEFSAVLRIQKSDILPLISGQLNI